MVHAYRRVLGLADRLDDAARRGETPARVVPGVWAALKLALVGLASPVLGPWVGLRSARNHRHAKSEARRFPELLDEILAGAPGRAPLTRVVRLPAERRWFVSSDLHRSVPGHLDWPTRQRTRELYDAALDHYAAGGWGVVENGDIDECWLVGGSSYGVVYDVGRMLAALLPGRSGAQLRMAVYAEHLRRIWSHNQPTMDRLRQDFHRHDRYVRLVGNHDDCYEDPTVVEVLRSELPGVPVADVVVLEDGPVPVGVVVHGHHTDAWNSPVIGSSLARFTSSLGSALHDLPVPFAPGLPTPQDTEELLAGGLRNGLTRVNGIFGATTGLDSLDEVVLFDACRARWQPGGDHLEEGPFLLMGHTHIPLLAPVELRSGSRWHRYANSGSALTHELVTGLEWDGTTAPTRPDLALVGWTADDRGEPLRVRFTPGPDGRDLRPDERQANPV